jgi:surface antigen
MKFRSAAVRFALVASCILMTSVPAQAKFWQCAPFARMISGVELHGNALTWWGQAAGKYERGATPKKGAVLAFAPTARMRLGHVATVSRVVNDREVLLTHANWSRRGAVETNVRAIDVSDAGDWSEVKVWYGPNGGLGTSAYPTHGFIYSGRAPSTAIESDDADQVAPVRIASNSTSAAAAAAAFHLDSLKGLTASN